MKKIYQNFDGLDVSFQCALPEYIRQQLRDAKLAAQEARKPIVAYIGTNEIPVAVAETGSKGGYTFRLSTGIDRAMFFIVDSAKFDMWNVRVSCSSLMLALYGYHETKRQILHTLIEDLEAINAPGEKFDTALTERISRFDWCVDFISDEFEPISRNFVIHNAATKSYFVKEAAENQIYCVERGSKMESICIGKMPNRQVILYNKRKEIIVHGKSYWWKLWKLSKKNFKGEIWRVEVRAGKKELNKWGIRRFNDLETKAGDVIIHILKNIKYTNPNETDKNRSRWPLADFWQICIDSANEYLAEYICNADRKAVIFDFKSNIRERYRKNLNGTLTSYTAALEMDISEIPGVLDLVRKDMIADLRQHRDKIEDKFRKAKDRMNFIDQKKGRS